MFLSFFANDHILNFGNLSVFKILTLRLPLLVVGETFEDFIQAMIALYTEKRILYVFYIDMLLINYNNVHF